MKLSDFQKEALLRNVEGRFKGISDFDRIHLTRLEREYEPILELCRLLSDVHGQLPR